MQKRSADLASIDILLTLPQHIPHPCANNRPLVILDTCCCQWHNDTKLTVHRSNLDLQTIFMVGTAHVAEIWECWQSELYLQQLSHFSIVHDGSTGQGSCARQ